MNRNQINILNTLGLFGMTLVLLIGFVLQFSLNELPCPLCLLQRIGFAMVMFGFLLNVKYGPQQRHYGVVLIGALFGAATALRQVSLHVIPGTPGYGSAIFGMHYYTWAFVLFSATILAVAILLMLWNEAWNTEPFEMSKIGRFVCLLAISVVALNMLSTFVECGPYQCPDNPVSYWLFN
ncbi:disulfide bond formation protein B [Vibrio coralliilyticus]|jgi:disulfide bond formation protein DsbB|uniref:disulfide bond formation protein B n=1 Tax=Vibrio coralliilyticus TaxID=190893 RepID=UPI0006CD03DE|nr:disulfide bond formation protein B [Vibrio coralliilyticus]AXN30987.1 disulfide bond formation protein B [Vibrio coralliilyticus]KPH27367.1 disulfide bond formation protein B [Vibrio coralliilyticus]NOI77535.1 disulfide bond formation protein B [Vibrio coralliilyticus]PAW02579.1 disulfide bond formation protein B [Vibrio coralliilyticus]